MALSSKEITKRLDFALSDMSSSGLLNPEQFNEFIDVIESEPTILSQVRTVRMRSPKMQIDRLNFGSRIMKVASQAGGANDDGSNDRHLTEANRSKPQTAQIELETKEMMCEVHLHDEVLEDNIERGNFEAHIMRQMGAQVARDLEEWLLEGDTGSGDAYLALNDGMLKSATSNVVDVASAQLTPDVIESGLLAMPQQYLRDLGGLRHWVPTQDSIRYRANVAKRATGYGDSALTGTGDLMAYGTPIESAPLMPTGFGIFTFPSNCLWGVQRDLRVETDRDIRARTNIIVMHMRVDFLYDDELAVVKYINIGS